VRDTVIDVAILGLIWLMFGDTETGLAGREGVVYCVLDRVREGELLPPLVAALLPEGAKKKCTWRLSGMYDWPTIEPAYAASRSLAPSTRVAC
jgi:hypothetical protein